MWESLSKKIFHHWSLYLLQYFNWPQTENWLLLFLLCESMNCVWSIERWQKSIGNQHIAPCSICVFEAILGGNIIQGNPNQSATSTLHSTQFKVMQWTWTGKKNSSHLINSRFCVIIGLHCIPVPCKLYNGISLRVRSGLKGRLFSCNNVPNTHFSPPIWTIFRFFSSQQPLKLGTLS